MCTHYILFQRARGNTQKAVMAQVDALERNMLLLLLKAEVARRCSLHVRDAVALAGLVCASDPSVVLANITADSHPLVHAMWACGRLMWLDAAPW